VIGLYTISAHLIEGLYTIVCPLALPDCLAIVIGEFIKQGFRVKQEEQ